MVSTFRPKTLPGMGSWVPGGADVTTPGGYDSGIEQSAPTYTPAKTSAATPKTDTDGGPAEAPFDLSALASGNTNYSGPPEWLMGILANLGQNFVENSFGDYQGAIRRLDDAPGNIEAARKGMVSKYVEGIQNPLNAQIQGAIGRAAGKGTLGSSMTGDALGGIAENFERGAQDVNRDTNLWAENQLLQNIVNKITAQGQFTNTLGSFMNMSRYGQGEGWNPNLGGLLPLMTGNV